MSGNTKSGNCDSLQHLVNDLTVRYPDLLREAPLLTRLAREVALYQIELEAQNEELRQSHKQIEETRQKYADLYNLAPAAYFTFNTQGLIQEANIAAGSVMGHDKAYLIGRPFAAHIDSRYVNAFRLHLQKAMESDHRAVCELIIERKDASRVPVLVESVAANNGSGERVIRSMISDIGQLYELKERLEFEELMSNLSTRFINVPSDEIDVEIETALRKVLEFFEADRCGILEVEEEKQGVVVTHAVCAQGIKAAPARVDLAALFPWHYEQLIGQGEITSFARLDQLPAEAGRDRATFDEWGIRSCLTIPMKVRDRVIHLLCMNAMREERRWGHNHARLRLLAEIFAVTLERKRKDLELKELRQQVERENIYLREEAKVLCTHEDIIGRSDALKLVLLQVEQVAPTDSTVLIMGETGTGKELIAQAIHRLSRRKHRTMVKVNCASLPATLVESELFGREKGAYTGALSKQVGRFEIANGATIFLDEIAELTPELQAKLLMVLQDGRFERLGSPQTIKVDVRVIAATNRDLMEAVRKGTFREDLYYRLNVFPIHVPPLRQRLEDIPLLVSAFVRDFARKMGKRIETVDRRTLDALQRYKWPGNIRELRNVIEQAVIMSSGDRIRIRVPQLPTEINPLDRNLRDMQYRHIMAVLETTGWRIKGPGGAAEILGVKPSTLYTKMESLNIPTRQEKAGTARHKI